MACPEIIAAVKASPCDDATRYRMRKAPLLRSLLSRLEPLDAFGALNAALFLLLAATTYWKRFRAFRPEGNFAEFFVYGAIIFTAILIGWGALRRFRFPLLAVMTLEFGILLHFAAGLLHPGGARLYDLQLGVSVFDYPLRTPALACIAGIMLVIACHSGKADESKDQAGKKI